MLASSMDLLRRLYRALPCENNLLKVVNFVAFTMGKTQFSPIKWLTLHRSVLKMTK